MTEQFVWDTTPLLQFLRTNRQNVGADAQPIAELINEGRVRQPRRGPGSTSCGSMGIKGLNQMDSNSRLYRFDGAEIVRGEGASDTPGITTIEGPCRLAVVSTPRAGNTWLRHLLRSLFRFDHPGGELAVHLPGDVPWASLPERCVLQLHWHRSHSFTSLLKEHQFRVVTLARHPIDVLISILRFAPFQPATALARWRRWRRAVDPRRVPSRPGLPRVCDRTEGEGILSVSREWWEAADCFRLRYEDLVCDTVGTLRRLADSVGGVPPEQIAGAIEANSEAASSRKRPRASYLEGAAGALERS